MSLRQIVQQPGSGSALENQILQIAGYLRHMLEKYEESEFVKYLVAPSPRALTDYFGCGEDAIYASLNELKRQGYEYETAGSQGPITLWDPLIRHESSSGNHPVFP
ncbi:MAG TPA: hypothetical protein V6C99_01830 [Oculatellaceae cyanobacterium]